MSSQGHGGELVPGKCFWYLINQIWLNGKWEYQTKAKTLAELVVADKNR